MLISHLPSYFKERRSRLQSENPGVCFLFPGHEVLTRNGDVAYPFRQESYFYYLTGFEEPSSFLVLTATGKSVLFILPKDPDQELWEGERYGIEKARSVFGMDEVYRVSELEDKIFDLFEKADTLGYHFRGKESSLDQKIIGWIGQSRRRLGRGGGALDIRDPYPLLGEHRLFKTQEEIKLLRKACEISALGHEILMKEIRPGMNEFEVEALIDFSFRRGGCQRVGYPTIAAGGKNAACLHYTSNNEILSDQDLLLVDAGGEFNYYTSDITRTFPVGRSFSPLQAKLYDLVLSVQKRAIEKVTPGNTLAAIHFQVCDELTEGLLSLGYLKGKKKELMESQGYRKFYPHQTSHWLGIDVHDAGSYSLSGKPRPLEPGMVLTIEPGFYLQEKEGAPFGIRIEDDILVTKNGPENLTLKAPKEREAIEQLRNL